MDDLYAVLYISCNFLMLRYPNGRVKALYHIISETWFE